MDSILTVDQKNKLWDAFLSFSKVCFLCLKSSDCMVSIRQLCKSSIQCVGH
jgi:hypothetical protein